MNDNEMRDLVEWALISAFKTITPWKQNMARSENADWSNGWNDCIKEIKKNRERYLKKFNEIIVPRKEKN
jgi:hypothetical protein